MMQSKPCVHALFQNPPIASLVVSPDLGEIMPKFVVFFIVLHICSGSSRTEIATNIEVVFDQQN